jgi:hypothetical protein
VKAIAAAAGMLEGRVIGSSELQSFVVDLYPGVTKCVRDESPLGLAWPVPKYLAERPQGCDEVSPHV